MKQFVIVATVLFATLAACGPKANYKKSNEVNGLAAGLVFDGGKKDHTQTASLMFQLTNVGGKVLKFPEVSPTNSLSRSGVMLVFVSPTSSETLVGGFPLNSVDGIRRELAPNEIAEILHEFHLEPDQKVLMRLCVNSSDFPAGYDGWVGCLDSNTIELGKN